MAKSPDRPSAPKGRHPAKHSKKDPAKPTRAKAARPDTPHLDPALAELLNPAIGRGRAGVGSQTGIEPSRSRADTIPSPLTGEGREGGREAKSQTTTPAQEHSSTHVQNLPTPTPNPSPQGGGEQMRARIAAMKPNAAAMQPSLRGMTSCRAPQARPPSGRWESIAAKPKGRGLRCSPIRGSRRRSSAITAARLRAKECAKEGAKERVEAGGAGSGCAKSMGYSLYVLAGGYRTEQEQCQGRNCFGNYFLERSAACRLRKKLADFRLSAHGEKEE